MNVRFVEFEVVTAVLKFEVYCQIANAEQHIPDLRVLAVPFMKRAYEFRATSLSFPRLKHRTALVYVWVLVRVYSTFITNINCTSKLHSLTPHLREINLVSDVHELETTG
jgi:hypothetical protein